MRLLVRAAPSSAAAPDVRDALREGDVLSPLHRSVVVRVRQTIKVIAYVIAPCEKEEVSLLRWLSSQLRDVLDCPCSIQQLSTDCTEIVHANWHASAFCLRSALFFGPRPLSHKSRGRW